MHLGLEGYVAAVLYFGAIVVFLLSVFWRPEVGVYFLVPLLPWQTVRYRLHAFPLGEKFVDIMLLGIILGLVFHKTGAVFPKTAFNRLLIIFGLFYYASLWRGSFYLGRALPLSPEDPRFSEWKNYMIMPLLFLVVAAAIKNVKQIKILVLLMSLSILMVNRSFYNLAKDRDFSHFSPALRDAGPLGYASDNGLAAFEAQFVCFILGLYAFEKKKLIKLGIFCVVLSSVYCLAYAFSRGGYAGLLVGLVCLGVLKEKKLLLVVMVLLIGWHVLLPNSVQERILMTYEEGEGADASTMERVSLWQDAMHIFDHNPVIGTGFSTYSYMERVGLFRDTHNYYLKVLVETGILGLLLFLWVLGKASRLGYALYRSAKDPFLSSLGLGFVGLMMCAVTVNLFGDRWTYLQVSGYLWALLGCIARGHLIVQHHCRKAAVELEPVSLASPTGHRASPA